MRRRTFLAAMLASAAPRPVWADVGSPAWLAAAALPDGNHRLHGLSAAGDILFALPLPARGHAATAHPERPEAVAFARRPGTFALVIDCRAGREVACLTPPDGRQFNGHGAYSADGSVLYTSEVVAESSEGRLGLWDATRSYARIGEWSTGGIGPHDVKRLPLSDDLIVANGGIQTDPTDRTKLNLDRMQPSLVRIAPDGRIIDQAGIADLPQNSIRHLAMLPDGRVAFALQWEGDAAEVVPLLGLWTPGSAPILLPAPETEGYVMQGYAGSVAYSPALQALAITSPRGGAVQVFGSDGRFIATHRRADVCGVAASPDGFLVTDGNGGLSTLSDRLIPAQAAPVAWDNHLIAL